MPPRTSFDSINIGHEAVGSSQTPLRPVANGLEVCTNTTLANVATIVTTFTKPQQSADLTAADCCFAVKRDPTYNMILKPVVGHATAPADLWGEAYIVGVRELEGAAGHRRYVREVLGLLKFQGSSSTFTPSTAATGYWPGLGDSPTLDVWAGCDVVGSTAYIPNPGIHELGEVVNGWASFGFDAWSHPWIEIYPSCTLPSGEAGSVASGISFWFCEC